MAYTANFSEVACVLAHLHPASYNSEQNTGLVNVGNYHRVAVIINCGVLGGDIDVDMEQATSATGTPKTIQANGYDITIHNADDDTINIIEFRTEMLDVDGGYSYVNVESTPGGASIYDVVVLGIEPRFAPVSTTALNELAD